MTINLTNTQLRNLILFLNRTQLQGSEAGALIELLLILQKEAQKILPPKPKKEEKK